jgi:hypothetical protein
MDRKPQLPILVLSGVWLLCFIVSFVSFAVTPPTGDSFLRGFNRLIILLGWQAGALLAAIVGGFVTFGRRQRISRGLQWVGFAPIIVSGLCAGGVVVVILLARF